MKKIIILIGNYGSGKTEIAINMALMASAQGKRTLAVDLDRINDYYRMSDQIKMLENKHISVVSPTFVGKGVSQTVMPAAVASAFDQDWDLVIFVGGDPQGHIFGQVSSGLCRIGPGAIGGIRYSQCVSPHVRDCGEDN